MYKAIKITLFFAFIALLPGFATASKADSGLPTTAISKTTPKLLGPVNANPTGVIGQIASNWQSNFPNGPFVVMLFNQTTGVWSAPIVTNNTFMIFNGLAHGNIYRVHVRDNDSIRMSAPVAL